MSAWLEIVDSMGTACVRRVPEVSRDSLDRAIGQARDDAAVMVRDGELETSARIVIIDHEHEHCGCEDGLLIGRMCKHLETASI